MEEGNQLLRSKSRRRQDSHVDSEAFEMATSDKTASAVLSRASQDIRLLNSRQAHFVWQLGGLASTASSNSASPRPCLSHPEFQAGEHRKVASRCQCVTVVMVTVHQIGEMLERQQKRIRRGPVGRALGGFFGGCWRGKNLRPSRELAVWLRKLRTLDVQFLLGRGLQNYGSPPAAHVETDCPYFRTRSLRFGKRRRWCIT